MRKTFLIPLSVLAIGACGGANNEFKNASPEASALSMEVTGDQAGEGLTTTSDEITVDDAGWTQQALGAQLPEYLQHARTAVKELNQAVLAVVGPIGDLIKENAGQMQPGQRVEFGPKDTSTATYRFFVQKAAPGRFGWLLQVKPLGAADTAYVSVMAGYIVRNGVAHRGKGGMVIDLTKLAGIDGSVKAQGQLAVGFSHADGYKILNYALKGFTPDPTVADPVSALLNGVVGPKGGRTIKLVANVNLADSDFPAGVTNTTAREDVILGCRWLPGVGGRCDGLATGGDIPQGHVYASFTCFDGALEGGPEGYFWEGDCSKPDQIGEAACTLIQKDGALVNCAKDLQQAETPPADPNAPATPPAGTPEDPTPPATMPDGSGN